MSKKIYFATELTGGADGSLDSLDGDMLNNEDAALVTLLDETRSYVYCLDDDSGATESSPNVITPDNNPGTKRWILTTMSAAAILGMLSLSVSAGASIGDLFGDVVLTPTMITSTVTIEAP